MTWLCSLALLSMAFVGVRPVCKVPVLVGKIQLWNIEKDGILLVDVILVLSFIGDTVSHNFHKFVINLWSLRCHLPCILCPSFSKLYFCDVCSILQYLMRRILRQRLQPNMTQANLWLIRLTVWLMIRHGSSRKTALSLVRFCQLHIRLLWRECYLSVVVVSANVVFWLHSVGWWNNRGSCVLSCTGCNFFCSILFVASVVRQNTSV